jgi:predicted amidohydrolase
MQEKHNQLYDFSRKKKSFSFTEAEKLQYRMIEHNFSLMEEGAIWGEFLLSSEAINFPGSQEQLSFPAWDLVNQGYAALTQRLHEFAVQKKAWLAIGLYRPLANGVLHNSVLVINRQGESVAIYDKIHLAGSEKKILSAGNTFCCFDSEFGKIGICICWDMQFPEMCRILALQGARLVLCPTWGWEQIYAGSRAYENGVYVAGVMAVPYNEPLQGIRSPSSVIDPEGSTIAIAGNSNSEIVCADIDLNREWEIHTIRMNERRPELYRSLVG